MANFFTVFFLLMVVLPIVAGCLGNSLGSLPNHKACKEAETEKAAFQAKLDAMERKNKANAIQAKRKQLIASVTQRASKIKRCDRFAALREELLDPIPKHISVFEPEDEPFEE